MVGGGGGKRQPPSTGYFEVGLYEVGHTLRVGYFQVGKIASMVGYFEVGYFEVGSFEVGYL